MFFRMFLSLGISSFLILFPESTLFYVDLLVNSVVTNYRNNHIKLLSNPPKLY